MTQYRIVLLFATLLIVLSAYVNAFGLSTPPWEDKTLTMMPGETQEIVFTLQNMDGDGDEKVSVSLETGTEVLRIIDNKDNYYVPLGRKDVEIKMEAAIPEDAPVGKEWDVKMILKSMIEREEGGMAGLTGGMIKTFKIKVMPKEQVAKPVVQSAEKKPKEKSSYAFLIGMTILVLIATVLILVIRSKKRSKEEEKIKKT